ncbi:RelA/SpoT domain-containing protein [Massilia sp. erpn]|uniref:RelA/SpoT domain-containing protein n=1 Tax=Massilia sp. erpn TaxID=2738142 RepID=UPI002106C393|nr:hypothetical protein [Massilia sp. erpn]UTY56159.1 hypothetical protein HPQ68_02500 [Massilia sp. erpn]
MMQRDFETFLATNRIKKADWELSNISWNELLLIGEHHETQRASLEAAASMCANLIQRFSAVHSVRWRVKDAEHLLEKIIRKRIKNNAKYMNISAANYAEIVDDLVGIRALHLFKSDSFEIDAAVRAMFEIKDTPIAYVRAGDNSELTKRYQESGFIVEDHPRNYRSIHYILATRPTNRVINLELQVRTIFEEGWSEIDHKVRYPNFSDDPQLIYLLSVFNGMAGNADDIGGFILKLASVLQNNKNELQEAVRVRDERIAKIEQALEELAEQRPELQSAQVAAVQTELQKIKADPHTNHVSDIGSEVANWMAMYTERGIEATTLYQQLKQIDGLSGFNAAQKAIEKEEAARRLMGNVDQFSALKMAKQAIEKEDEVRKLLISGDRSDALEAAKKAIEREEAARKVVMGIDQLSATERVKRVIEKEEATRRSAMAVLQQHNAIEEMLKKK